MNINLSKKELEELSIISSLHDIGMINIAIETLSKQSPLNDDEWEMIKKHSMDGYSMTNSIKEFKAISKYILFHHEHWDGNGYPYGLKGEAIPILSRIVSIADAYDTMTRDKSYKGAMSKESALRELRRNRGRQFDPDIVDRMMELSDRL